MPGPPYTPVLVTSQARSAEQEIENSFQGSRVGPWDYLGNLFVVGQAGFGAPDGNLAVYKSTDGGLTWAEVDAANHPLCAGSDLTGDHMRTFNVARDGVDRSGSILHIVYATPRSEVHVSYFMAIITFDLVTEKWGAPHISAYPNVPLDPSVYLTEPHFNVEYRSQAGDLVLLDYENIYQATPAGVFTPIGALTFTNTTFPGATTCLCHAGANEWIYCFWADGHLNTTYNLRNQSIALDNSISAPDDILVIGILHCPAGFMGSTTTGDLWAIQVVLDAYADGVDVVCPYMVRLVRGLGPPPVLATDLICVGQVARGTPGASPAWTIEEFFRTIGFDQGGGVIEAAPYFNGGSAFRDGATGKLGIVRNNWAGQYHSSTDYLNQLILSENTSGSSWGPDIVLWAESQSDYNDGDLVWNTLCVIGDANSIGFNLRFGYGLTLNPQLNNDNDRISLWVIAAGTHRSLVSIPVQGGSRRIVILVPNKFDYCLREEIHRMGLVEWDKPHCCVPPIPDIYFNWIKEPHEGTYFRRVGSIPTPLPIDGDQLVLTYRSPLGYDGVVRGLFHRYTGPGFRDGGGDIIWRLMIQNVYARQMGAITVQMGQIGQPYAIRDGIPFTSNRSIRYYVNVPNLSGGILPVNSQIVCGIEGWVWPRR